MALDTDLSRAPYFDDYTPNSNHYAVLYRPGVPVQAREMNEVQSILQDQIDKFGRSIYKEGSVIEGCAFSFDNKYAYVKIKDNYANGSAFTISDFEGRVVTNGNGLKALVVKTVPGFESQDPNLNTLYIRYLNATTYANGQTQTVFSPADNLSVTTTSDVAVGNVTVSSTTSPIGYGYAMTVTDGVIFKKGYFIRVEAQTVLVNKYINIPPNVSVGFVADETIETPAANSALYDNAQGTPNYGAPGAHRLKITPQLVVKPTADITNSDTFFSLCDFQNGKPVTIKNDPQYSALGTQLARRTFETNGDFVVNPFLLTTEMKKINYSITNAANTTHLNLISSPGLAYVKGYRVEFLNKNYADLRKGIDTKSFASKISANFGYYLYVDEFVGDFDTDSIESVELHSVQYSAINNGTFLDTSYQSKKIGTAHIRGIEYFSGTPGYDAKYIVYLFDINIDYGYNFNQVRSIVSYKSSSVRALADIVLSYDYSTNSNIPKLEEITASTMVFSLGQKAVVSNSFNNTSYVYRNRANATFNGSMSITLAAASGAGSETFTYGVGSLSQSQIETFVLVPAVNGYSTNNSGNVTTSNTSNVVIGSGTSFTSDYRVGDIIYVSNTTVANTTHNRIITAITNSTYLSVNSPFPSTAVFTDANHQLKISAGQPISMLNRAGRSIDILSPTTANISLGFTPNTPFDVSVYHDVLRESTVAIKKKIKRGTIVKIDTSNNVAGTSGPWCLGVTDVLKINNVWISTNGSYSNTVVDSAVTFTLDNGQRDCFYDLAYIKSNFTDVPAGSKILVSLDHFEHDQTEGRGFFTANSYPIDDVNRSANNNAIVTAEIPLFTSPSKGSTFDLRDCVDFRPFVANTANMTSDTSLATINPNSNTSFSGAADCSIPGTLGSYTISPNQLFETNLSHYLSRKDRVSITTEGKILVTEGIPSVNPKIPTELPGTMSIGTIDIAPYPTLAASEAKLYNRYDYAPVINLSQIKRYTMADINTLSNRINNLEYYTSLSALEQSATNLLVRSGTTGQNRFKNGILVEPFRGHDIGNTLNPQYSIAIDPVRQEARPAFRLWTQELVLDRALSTGYKQAGHKITIQFNSKLQQKQPFASRYHNCVEGNIYTWKGNITLYPSGDLEPDRTTSPDITNNLDLGSNWINLKAQSAYGTVWGNWVTTNYNTSYGTGTTSKTSQYNDDGSVTDTYQTQTNVTTTQDQIRTGVSTTTTSSNNTLDLGTFVTDVSIQPYVRPRQIFFSAYGLKPNSQVFAYFASTKVNDFCVQIYEYTGALITKGNAVYTSDNFPVFKIESNTLDSNTPQTTYFTNYGKNWGSILQVQPDGTIHGVFSIPKSTFKIGDIQFRLVDIPDLAIGDAAITTDAMTTYTTSGLSLTYAKSILNTRQTTVTQTEVQESRSIQQTSVSYDSPIIIKTPPPPPIPVANVQPIYNITIANTSIPIQTTYNNIGVQDLGGGDDGGGGGPVVFYNFDGSLAYVYPDQVLYASSLGAPTTVGYNTGSYEQNLSHYSQTTLAYYYDNSRTTDISRYGSSDIWVANLNPTNYQIGTNQYFGSYLTQGTSQYGSSYVTDAYGNRIDRTDLSYDLGFGHNYNDSGFWGAAETAYENVSGQTVGVTPTETFVWEDWMLDLSWADFGALFIDPGTVYAI